MLKFGLYLHKMEYRLYFFPFQKNFLVAILASLGVILGAAYMLWLSKRVIFGVTKNSNIKNFKDVNLLEGSSLIILAFLVIYFGVHPELIFDTVDNSVNKIILDYNQNLNFYLSHNK